MTWRSSGGWLTLCLALWGCWPAQAQIDPEKRQLIELGYSQPIEGRGPLSAYAYFYYNRPQFPASNLVLRLAVAPVYLDSELGIREALGRKTDLGIGLSGGGFADSYSEVRDGRLLMGESFTGHGGEIAASLYHRFNPDQQIPLNAVIRGSVRYSAYLRDDETDEPFVLPKDRATFVIRSGLRLGGREPTMFPDLAMEVSAWYEGQFRSASGSYGFDNDRAVARNSHLFWGRALLIYTFPELKHTLSLGVTAGTSIDADRFSAYRLGGALPLVSEFPLMIPGYYFQEISATDFGLISAYYYLPLDRNRRWGFMFSGGSAAINYLPGFELPGTWHSGVGGNLIYRSPAQTWHIALGYAYGFNAVRSGGQGANSIGILLQCDLEADKTGQHFLPPWMNPNNWRGFQRMFGGN